ncbi:MAG TPA: hypothetical protein ENJ28_05025 [Gammaproteobacteria bacterium]|nr:hypothetical protein [Gammaproteobacteria bacterium]
MTDEIVTPENTKLIAEWMGYKSRIVDAVINCKAVYIIDEDNIYNAQTEYNPITNADQSREIEEKLLKLGYEIICIKEQFYSLVLKLKSDIVEESLPLAIYKAALFVRHQNAYRNSPHCSFRTCYTLLRKRT